MDVSVGAGHLISAIMNQNQKKLMIGQEHWGPCPREGDIPL